MPGLWHAEGSQLDFGEDGSQGGFHEEEGSDPEGFQEQGQEEEEEDASQVDYDENGSGEGFDGEGDLDYEGSQGQNQDEEGGEGEHASVGEYNEDQEAEEGMPR